MRDSATLAALAAATVNAGSKRIDTVNAGTEARSCSNIRIRKGAFNIGRLKRAFAGAGFCCADALPEVFSF
jgi:hypothetical protein